MTSADRKPSVGQKILGIVILAFLALAALGVLQLVLGGNDTGCTADPEVCADVAP